MFLKDMKSGYLGTLKIKSIYLGNSLIYQDSKPVGLYTLQLGPCINTSRVIVPKKYQVTTECKMLKLGGA